MNEIFNFSKLKDHNLYHVRYGRGAVIIAIKKPDESSDKRKIDKDKHAAQLFASREQNLNDFTPPRLDPIESIEEINGMVRIHIIFNRTYDGNPTYRPVEAVIERLLRADQVTLEIVKEKNT